MLRFGFLFFFLCLIQLTYSQSIEWLKYREGKKAIQVGVSALDDQNNYYIQTYEDTSLGFQSKPGKWELNKFTEFGDSLCSATFPFSFYDLKVHKNSDIYGLVLSYDTDFNYQGYNYPKLNLLSRYFLVILDSALNFKELHLLSDSARATSPFPSTFDFFNDGSVFFSLSFNDSIKIDNQSFYSLPNSRRRKVVGRYEINSRQFIWLHSYQFIYGQFSNYDLAFEYDITTDINQARILIDSHVGYYRDGIQTSHTGEIGYNDLDINGNLVNEWYWKAYTATFPKLTALKSGRIMFSLRLDPVSLYRIGNGPMMSSNFQVVDYLHQFSKTGNLDWVISTDTVGYTPATLGGNLQFGAFIEKNGFSYAICHASFFRSTFGGLSFPSEKPGFTGHNGFIVRFDTLGNMISNIKLPYTLFGGISLELDQYGNPICSGIYIDTLQILDSIIIGTDFTQRNLYHFKLGDFYILRGPVSSGPFCAGDSFDIPFKAVGTYNSHNEFIAELSDEKGLFLGNERELGRIKSSHSDTIIAKLPLFSVESSPDYRIRIRSTSPNAQSFFRRDSLRLLVYSKDSANAGKDTLLCSGQSIQLYTSGGSRWAWSPALNLNDSTLKRPRATPSRSTLYQIIISDSSGCGDTDTDYVYIEVRKPLKVDSLVSTIDTACIGQELELKAFVSGGDSLNYSYLWKSDQIELSDSLFLIAAIFSDTVFHFLLSDGCTVNSDSQNIAIKTRGPLKLQIIKDSTCFHDTVSFTAISSGGDYQKHQVQWNSNGVFQNANFTYKQYTDTSLWVYASLVDNCTVLIARDSMEAFVYPKAAYTILDTSGCSPFLFEPKINKKNKVVYSQTWQIENLTDNSETPSIELMQSGTYNWMLILNTGFLCSDTLFGKEQIYVEEAPKAEFKFVDHWLDIDDPLVKLRNISAGFIAGQEWEASNGFYSQDINPQIQFSDSGLYKIKLRVWSPLGCSNEYEDSIRIHDIYTISIPNAFTPNGDSKNTVFEPVLTGYSNYKMSIVDRWGEVIFESENMAWDGTFKGKPVQDGVFLYRIDIKTEKGNRYFYSGSVYVLH